MTPEQIEKDMKLLYKEYVKNTKLGYSITARINMEGFNTLSKMLDDVKAAKARKQS
jgi:hypothetical protein